MISQPLALGPTLPAPRGPVTDALIGRLRRGRGALPRVDAATLDGDDAQLALHCCYELHYRGFRDAVCDLEWDTDVLRLRADLEAWFVDDLEAHVPASLPTVPSHVERWLAGLAGETSGPSLSAEVRDTGTIDQLRELCIHRSAYQLKEADPHTWAIPRLVGEAKAAMVEIQGDEYGDGRAADMHAVLFGSTMRAFGLDATYGHYLDRLPGVTLATGNLISLFGLHRRWRGALVGHLALFEMTSVGPMGRYSEALARLGLGPQARRFYDVHVEADAHHEVIALERMVRGLLADEPQLARDVAFGAAALTLVESRFAAHLRSRWDAGLPSLLDEPLARAGADAA